MEVERLRAAAAAELTHEEVKPIQSDFHFFCKENAPRFRAMAEDEIKKSLDAGEKVEPFLVNSNLNSRLKMAWENLTDEERDAFMIKEEDDRRRFMEEDEIASRHCATLTARGKSPRTPEKPMKTDTSNEPAAEEIDAYNSAKDEADNDEISKKRLSHVPEDERDAQESPTKRNRQVGDE